MYDIIIIGGGIGGLNTALKLSNKKILLLDERKYWGGRINTNKQPQYEIGAARFSNKHKILNKLIKKYRLKTIPLSKNIDFLDKEKGMIQNVNILLDNYFLELIKKSKKWEQSKLKSMTLYDFMNNCNDIKLTNKMIDIFGYYSEIKEMNAYDALNTFSIDFVNTKYFCLQNGLSELCNKIIEDIKVKGGICINNTRVIDVKKINNNILIETNKEVYKCKKVVFSIKGQQLKQFDILKPIHKYTKCLYNAELLRIYAKYPIRNNGVWFSSIRRTTTNSFLRQIIPIDYEKGLIMISYTDGNDIKSFKDKNGKIMNDIKIKSLISNELNNLFGNIPQPTYFKVHYWEIGAHHWKPGYDSEEIHNKMINPIDNIYICGEAFSKKQAWIEGALETSESVIKSI